jgi:hypothetical protein
MNELVKLISQSEKFAAKLGFYGIKRQRFFEKEEKK